jgi:UDP-GlcNAc:undecaprenyl-phosphate GlcNAc-1-phosphate transferase
MMDIKILAFFFVYSLVIGYFLHNFFVKRASQYKIKKANTSAERWSSQSKPILGGITFYVMFIFAIVNYGIIVGFKGLVHPQILGAIIVVTIGFMMGLADDMLNTPPGFKFLMQTICAIVLIYSGVQIDIFTNHYANLALTLFWVIGIMNSVNMLDNMDAITTSVSIAVLLAAIVVLLVLQPFSGALLYLTVGSLAGFVSFLTVNWHPSKMYMGDNGSQFIGAFLAIVGIELFWNQPASMGVSVIDSFVIILLLFLVPISDTTAVTINRIMRGQSPFVGGRDHTTHHLSYFGLKDNQVAWLLLSINFISAAGATLLILKKDELNLPTMVFGAIAGIVLVALYSITKISKPKHK